MRQQRSINQQGIVSIMVATMLIIVAALLVLGLAQIARREARESTDTLLTTQAFYAAETGVNDAKAQLSTMDISQIVPKTQCTNQPPYNFTTVLDASNQVEYTCLLINPTPTTLTTTLGPTARILPLQTDGTSALGTLQLKWTVPDGSVASTAGCPAAAQVNPSNDPVFSPGWSCHYGVLRVDLVGTGASSYNRSHLLSNMMTIFIVPSTAGGAGSASFSASQKAAVGAAGGCSSKCSFNISGLSDSRYYIRVSEIYKTGGTLNLSLASGSGFTGAQAAVDATGKAQDVLRRIRVALDISGYNPNASAPGAIVSGDSICKQFQVTPDPRNSFLGSTTSC